MSRQRPARPRRGQQVPLLEQLRLLDEEQTEANRVFEERRSLLLRQHAFPTPTGIQSVPPEILAETFSHLVDGDSRNLIFPSHVCRLWRDVILREAALWTCIHIGDRNESVVVALRFLKTCKQRARERSLSLSINNRKKLMSMGSFKNTFAVLTRTIRWESISLTTSQIEECVVFINDLPPSSIAAIKELSFSTSLDRPTGRPFGEKKSLDLQRFTALKALTLDFPNPLSKIKGACSWDQLTDLKLTSRMHSVKLLAILRRCVSLENCSLSPDSSLDKIDLGKGERPPKKARLLKLKKLELVSEHIPFLLPATLVCPILQEATFFYKYDYGLDDSDDSDYDSESDLYQEAIELKTFICKCAETLRKLRVPGMFGNILRACLPKLNSLEELVVVAPYHNAEYWAMEECMDDCGIESFFPPLIITSRSICLPRLRILQVLEQPNRTKDRVEDYIFEIAKSRMSGEKGVAHLERIILKTSSQRTQKLEKYRREYQEWESQGLLVDFDG
ncbi:hypothetical protein NLJ89_g1609 [Agrocybe chaxingu]|uniref:F-box domain-containing protein n=1 Tax=Agrocybe chaxingu TaxID=84603 RepID=A0A9W8MZQ8_9AGAR|nr:hypothetical protein NLJ89_g1609 [Agrocybe chaxingu]